MWRSAAISSVAVCLALTACGGDDEPSGDERDRAIAAAEDVYDELQASRPVLEIGPCIAEKLPGFEDWVVDIAHDPREWVDDEPANQCERYREGEASHFVELTPQGDLIRAE